MDFLSENPLKKVWFAPYELKRKGINQIRKGTLLKVEFADGKTGHADLHPYPEKGEADLKTQLNRLKEKKISSLCLRAFHIARVEADAQAKNINLLSTLSVPLSHYLILDVEKFSKADLEKELERGFKVFKVKLNHPLHRQSKKLLALMQAGRGKSLKWRLDFHTRLSVKQWEKWQREYLKQIPAEDLDFIEAPFNYQESFWQKNKKISLALDVWEGENTLPVSVLVWKIARKNPEDLSKKLARNLFKRVIFTHSLSHPLDQIASAYFSASFYKVHPGLREICGLVQKDIYEGFTLPDFGPVFPKLSGPGWGLDICYLSSLPWKKLF